MDEEWKKQNEAPAEPDSPAQDSGAGQTPSPQPLTSANPGDNPSTGTTPGQTVQPRSVPQSAGTGQFFGPDTPANQNTYAQYDSAGGSSKRKMIIIISGAVLAVILIGAGVYAFSGKKSDNKQAPKNFGSQSQPTEQTAEAPADWAGIDTQLGFALKAPSLWTVSPVSDSSFSGLAVKSMSISASANHYENSISTGVETFTESPNSQADFEKAVTEADRIYESLKILGINKSQLKITGSKTKINGREWTQVDTSMPNQFIRTLYLWNNDHAVFVKVISFTQDVLDSQTSSYLLPAAASLELK